jgi:protease-4
MKHLRKVTGSALMLCVIIGLSGCVMVNLSSLFSNELEEIVLFEEDAWLVFDKILLLDVSGMITSESLSGLFSETSSSPDRISAVLNKARQDRNIKAVLLRINSPGGGVAATDLIAHEIQSFARTTGLPVYAHILDVGASGGYYVASVADRIYAEPTCITGSIGVIMSLPKFKELAEKVGYEQVVIKSGKMKDLGNALRDMSEEERRVFEEMVLSMYNRFLDVIVAGRPAFDTREQLLPLADGRVFTAEQAREHGLIDEVAHMDRVLQDLKAAAGLRRAHVITYSFRQNPEATLYSPTGSADAFPVRIDWPSLLPAGQAGLYYLWLAGE